MKVGEVVKIVRGQRVGEIATVVKIQGKAKELNCVIVRTQDGELWVYRMKDLELLCN